MDADKISMFNGDSLIKMFFKFSRIFQQNLGANLEKFYIMNW